MNRGDAYKLLTARLEQLRGEGYDALLSRVGQPAVSERSRVNGEDVAIETAVVWAERKRGTIEVRATALGPSTWLTQRLDESFVVGPNE